MGGTTQIESRDMLITAEFLGGLKTRGCGWMARNLAQQVGRKGRRKEVKGGIAGLWRVLYLYRFMIGE